MIKLADIKPNPDNPRVIKDQKFERLCKSIKEFPKMMELRPIVVDGDGVVLGGNMRLRALQHLKFTEVPDGWVRKAADLTDDERRRFIISDNASFGEWDYDQLANEWDAKELTDWGVDVPNWEGGDIIELSDITTTFNINIKCDNPDELEQMKFKLGITSNSIHSTMLIGLLA